MEEPNNLCEILEIAAENQWPHGLLIDLPQDCQRDTTQYSNYDDAFNHKKTPKETEESGEGKDNEEDKQYDHPEDSKEPEDDKPELPMGWISYKTLLNNVRAESYAVEALMNMRDAKIVLVCTDNQLDHIHWFWAVVCAGGVPCMATKFSDDLEQRKKQILNLKETLDNPLILTSSNLRHLFADEDGKQIDGLTLWTFSQIQKSRARILEHRPLPTSAGRTQWVSTNPNSGLRRLHTIDYNGLSVFIKGHTKGLYDLAALMLTSGSTGNAKAVCLTSAQIIASVQGKIAAHNTTSNDVFFSWTGMEHVANLMEIHMHAMYLGANQIMVPAVEVENPLVFLKRIHDHRVAYTFAPNFFLGDLIKSIPDISVLLNSDDRLDLSCLRALVSGGELNVTKTCTQLTALLTQLGAPDSFIRPAFGMTETCAGCSYNVFDCPVYDIVQNNRYACLGYGMQGVEIQISEEGELLLRGPAIFSGYYNNEVANADAFDEEGWFCTGDLGRLDANYRLHLTGRIKDMVIVNGICHPPQGIEDAINDAAIPGVTPTFTAAFGFRNPDADTESLVVVYLPEKDFNDPAAIVLSATAISNAVVMYCGVRPFKVIPVDEAHLEKSSLGKLSRSKIKMYFEAGDFEEFIQRLESQVVSPMDQPAET